MPEDEWDYQGLTKAIEKDDAEIRSDVCKCKGQRALNSEGTAFNDNLRRYRLPKHTSCRGCNIGSGIYEDAVHMLLRMADKKSAELISILYEASKNSKSAICQCKFQKYLKRQTAYLKLGGKFIHESWRWGVHWEMFFGYAAYRGVKTMGGEIEEWLVNRRVLGGPLGEERYMRMMAEETLKLCQEEWKTPKSTDCIEDWVSTGEWMRGKAGNGKTTTVRIDGKDKKTRRMKGVDAVYRSDKHMCDDLTQVKDEVFAVMEKSEGVKVRPVVKTGADMFRKMDFLSQWVEDGFYYSGLSTLFGGPSNHEDIDEELMRCAEDSSLWKIPLDQSNFDWHQSKLSIEVVMATMGIWISRKVNSVEFNRVWEAMWDSLLARRVVVRGEGIQYEWSNGLPSGLRWTALLDTILNITSFRVAVRLAESRLRRKINIHCHKSQGDDIAFGVKDLEEAKWIIHIYNKLGYEAHPAKTYFSRYRTEFLRKSYEAGLGITGYICRSLLGIRFRNPILELPVEKTTRVYSRLCVWHLISIRGAKGYVCGKMFIEDCTQMGVKPIHAAGFALCPAAFGGGGLSRRSSIARGMLEHYEGNYTYEVVVEKRRITPSLGFWNLRIRDGLDRYLTKGNYEHLYMSLAASWGIRETDLVGDVSVVWKRCTLKPLATGPGSLTLPKASKVWEVSRIPTMARSHVKEGSLDSGNWNELVKPGCLDWLLRLQKNVSKTVFREYMLERINVPWPIVDGMAMKYGGKIREEFDRRLRSYICKRDMGILELARVACYLEEKITRRLEQMSSIHKWGV